MKFQMVHLVVFGPVKICSGLVWSMQPFFSPKNLDELTTNAIVYWPQILSVLLDA